jgi:hypothetical protein
MTRRAKIAIGLTAAAGFLFGSWATTLVIPTEEGGCVTSRDGLTTRCTLDPIEPWRFLVGGVPVALVLAGLVFVLVRRHEQRISRDFAKDP